MQTVNNLAVYVGVGAHMLCGAQGPKGPAAQRVQVRAQTLIFAAIYWPFQPVSAFLRESICRDIKGLVCSAIDLNQSQKIFFTVEQVL